MTNAISAKSTALIWNGRKLAELLSISGPSQKVDMIDVSNHDSANAFKEFKAGLVHAGEITIEGNFIASDSIGQITLNTDIQARTSRAAFVVLPMSAGVAWSFTGYGSAGPELSAPHDGKLGFTAALMVTGKPTLLTTQTTGISAMTGIEENAGAALSLSPAIAAGTYAYTCTVNTASTWVKLTVTAASHTIYIAGTAVATGVLSGEIALGAAGTDTVIDIVAYESAKAPRLYTVTVTRPSA